MAEIIKILNNSREFLSLCQKESLDSLEDPLAGQWKKVDFHSLEPILTTLGISSELHFYCKQYHEKAKKLSRETSLLTNELENIEADVLLKPSRSPQVLSAAQNFAHDCRQNLEPRLDDLLGLRTNLKLADQALKERLSLAGLIELARTQTTNQKKIIFDTGYAYFSIIADENDGQNNAKTIQDHFAAAATLERQLEEIELPDLPPILHDIINQQIKTGLEATAATKDFITFCTNSCKTELNNAKEFHDRLNALRDMEIQEITSQLQPVAEKLSAIICEFYYKADLVKNIDRLEILGQDLRLLLETFKGNFLEELASRTGTETSPLHPAGLAQKMSKNYFAGIKGLLRIIKLLFGSASGRQMISETELKEKLQTILSTCSLYCSDSKNAIEKMKKFIHGHLEMYQKPFPYNELFAVSKKIIVQYGETVEKEIFRYQINPSRGTDREDEDAPGQNQLPGKKISLGRLIARIEARASALQRIQSDDNE